MKHLFFLPLLFLVGCKPQSVPPVAPPVEPPSATLSDIIWHSVNDPDPVKIGGQIRNFLTAGDDRELPNDARSVLITAIKALGFISRKDVLSQDFLEKCTTEPIKWNLGSEDASRGYSIHALGLNGNERAVKFLADLKTRDDWYLHRFAGDIVRAEFYMHCIKKYGDAEFIHRLRTTDALTPEFMDWAYAEGQERVEWANDKTRGPRPKAPPVVVLTQTGRYGVVGKRIITITINEDGTWAKTDTTQRAELTTSGRTSEVGKLTAILRKEMDESPEVVGEPSPKEYPAYEGSILFYGKSVTFYGLIGGEGLPPHIRRVLNEIELAVAEPLLPEKR